MPEYYDGVYEMEELLKAQGKALSDFDKAREQVLFNQYIAKADERGISVFENQYGITPEPGDSLEVRRQRLLMRVLPPQPITFRYLEGLFKSLKIPAKISVEHLKRRFNVISYNGELSAEQQKLITLTLNCYLPANMLYIYQTWYKCEPARAYIGSAVACKVKAVTQAEVLDKEGMRRKFYEFGLWQKTPNGKAYIGSHVSTKVVATVQAERREL